MPDQYRAGKRLWSAADDAAMRAEYPDTPTPELAKRFRRPISSVHHRARVLGIKKSAAYMASPHACRLRRGDHVGARTRFTKGHVPANKGTRRPGWSVGRMKETQFKPGESRNRMPVGSTRWIEGYLYRKVSEVPNVAYTVNWKLEHRLLWEATNGPIPEGHALRFLNGDTADIRLDNLQLVARRDIMRRNSVHNLPKELAQAVQLLGALNGKIRRRSKHAEK